MYIKNSLTNKKEEFILHKDRSNNWYSCGPTIYDDAHLGHARSYITFDVIRRILEKYGYPITYMMNITDIDDKIINKVRTLHNIDNFDESNKDLYYKFISDMENNFFLTMDKLNIKRPHITTRVTDHIESIINYIQKIINNGLAYESNGSIYLDHGRYIEMGGNIQPFLGKCMNFEDNWSQCDFTNEKKHPTDFALWKSAKSGEMYFKSPWGNGRPAWHIECSVVTNEIFGNQIDIHSGGIDLLFPHHTNEIIQANAYNKDMLSSGTEWVKYFIHSGHLHIDGNKMAKSLKNFITIDYYLENIGNYRELRLLFLSHNWEKHMDYTQTSIEEAKFLDNKINNFINHVAFVIQNIVNSDNILDKDKEFQQDVINFKKFVDEHLLDNFDTPSVIKELLKIINKTYSYIETSNPNHQYVNDLYKYIIELMDIFGVGYNNNLIRSGDLTKKYNELINISIEFREKIRNITKKYNKDIQNNAKYELYNILDDFRDNKLSNLGITIQDLGQGKKTKYIVN